jgi:hypothetical protein
MIMPWRVTSERQRAQVSNALRAFNGFALVPAVSTGSPASHQRLSSEMRQHVLTALQSNVEPQRHIWIASGRQELPESLSSLLHATVDPAAGARVDILLSLVERNDPQATGYDGFGELTMLTLLLERMGIVRLEVPLPLDAHRAGLTSAGWTEREPGVFVWEKTTQAQPSR